MIEFHCPHCDKLLKTPDSKAGVRANCPGCGQLVTVPDEPPMVDIAEEAPGFDDSPPPVPSAPTSTQRTASASGRAGTIPCPMCGEQINRAAVRCRFCGENLSPSSRGRRNVVPHRGVLILVLSILGLVICLPFGIAAWIMGHQDLKEMDAGRMDDEGRGLTLAGKIIGMVQCILAIIGLLFVLGMFLLAGLGALAN
jgi:hypothetical protein